MRSLLLIACAGLSHAAAAAPQDPTQAEVALPAGRGWEAALVESGGPGVWCTRSLQIFDRFGCPEIVGCDDDGRLTVYVSYSGKWTPNRCPLDHQWLGPVLHADLDPTVPGRELYTGGQSGNVYQVVPILTGNEVTFDKREIAHFAEDEVHTIIAAELNGEPGLECLVFNRGGALNALECGDDGSFRTRSWGQVLGRVRDAVVLPATDDRGTSVLTCSRAGTIQRLHFDDGDLVLDDVLREPMGLGRLALAPGSGDPVVYASRDDGVILRLALQRDGTWSREAIFAGPQGPRGLVAGRFDADHRVETVAVFGYSQTVHLLSRAPRGEWQAQVIFEDTDKGHWLGIAELDGRNGTDEIIGSGYSGRIFQLRRPPGYGLAGAAITGSTSTGSEPPAPAVEIALSAGERLSGCAAGQIDPTSPAAELVAVSGSGKVFVAERQGSAWRARPVWDGPGELIQCAVGDLDADHPGDEIAVVGMIEGEEDKDRPGGCWVLVREGETWRAELVHESARLVHAVAIADGVLYSGGFDDVIRAWRRSNDEWSPAGTCDVDGAGGIKAISVTGELVFAACAGGGMYRTSFDGRGRHPASELDSRGFGRARLDARENYVAVGDDDGTLSFNGAPIFKDSDKLRGVAIAELNGDPEQIELACAGYSGKVTVLRFSGAGFDAEVIHQEPDKIHHLAHADLDGDGIEELIAASYTGNLLVLRAHAR